MARGEKIILKKFVEAYKLSDLPLRPSIDKDGEAKKLAQFYYGTEDVYNLKAELIWKFHQMYYSGIATLYNQLCTTAPSDHHESFTANVCAEIMTNIIENHRGNELVEYKQFAVTVCSGIASAVHSSNGTEDRHAEPPPADVIDVIEHGEDWNSEDEMQHDMFTKCVVTDDEGTSYPINEGDNNVGAEIPIVPTGSQVFEKEKEDIFSKVGLTAGVASSLTGSNMARKRMKKLLKNEKNEE
eukprot:gene1960-2228_t